MKKELDSAREQYRKLKPKNSAYALRGLLFKDTDKGSNLLADFNFEIKLTQKLTFWDLYFYFKSNSDNYNWHDIEHNISTFLVGEENVKYLSSWGEIGGFKVNNAFDDEAIIKLCSVILRNKGQDYKNRTALNFLMDELNQFENDFAFYLKKQTHESNTYNGRAIDLALHLMGENFNDDKFYIISFNYTMPIQEDSTHQLFNVHGSIEENNIIIGIDSADISPKDDRYIFTKTYRQLIGSYATKEYNGLPSPEETTEINFYGHSLSEADYSYFQSVFDYYSIYDSNIKINFFASTYKIIDDNGQERNLTDQEIQVDQAAKITKMLDTYSTVLFPEGQHRNLIHKLLLEKRLYIKVINPDEIFQEQWK